jgi:glycosyltransferase involved in cell wall biosynthesis
MNRLPEPDGADMENQPLVSVVVTCYNYGSYLKDCLDSILAQTYSNFEIVVVDDGSTDNTAEVIKPFRELPNIRYIHQENAGQAKAKNVGIKNSTGNFIAFLDADDLWEKSKLEKQIPFFDNPNVGVVYSGSRPIDADGNLLKWGRPGKYLVARSGNISNWLFFDNFIVFSSSVVRYECFTRIGVFNENYRMGIDWDLWLRISTIYEFDFVDQELLLYRIGHPGQMSKNAKTRQECSDKIMESFIREYPDYISKSTISKAYSYSFCNRGNYYFNIDKKTSRNFFIKALLASPLNMRSYLGMLKTFL